MGPRQRPRLPLRAAHKLKPPALPGGYLLLICSESPSRPQRCLAAIDAAFMRSSSGTSPSCITWMRNFRGSFSDVPGRMTGGFGLRPAPGRAPPLFARGPPCPFAIFDPRLGSLLNPVKRRFNLCIRGAAFERPGVRQLPKMPPGLFAVDGPRSRALLMLDTVVARINVEGEHRRRMPLARVRAAHKLRSDVGEGKPLHAACLATRRVAITMPRPRQRFRPFGTFGEGSGAGCPGAASCCPA